MSTPVVTPPVVAPVAPQLTSILNYFNTYATLAASVIAAEQADITAGNHVAAVNDAVAGAAAAVATAMPTQAANVQAAFNLFMMGETLVTSIVNLFHHPKATVAAAAAVSTSPKA